MADGSGDPALRGGPLWAPRPKPRGCRRARGQGLGDKEIQVVNTPVPRGGLANKQVSLHSHWLSPTPPQPPPATEAHKY